MKNLSRLAMYDRAETSKRSYVMGLRGPNAHGGKKRKAKRKHPSVSTWRRKGLSRAEKVIRFLESLPVTKGHLAARP